VPHEFKHQFIVRRREKGEKGDNAEWEKTGVGAGTREKTQGLGSLAGYLGKEEPFIAKKFEQGGAGLLGGPSSGKVVSIYKVESEKKRRTLGTSRRDGGEVRDRGKVREIALILGGKTSCIPLGRKGRSATSEQAEKITTKKRGKCCNTTSSARKTGGKEEGKHSIRRKKESGKRK